VAAAAPRCIAILFRGWVLLVFTVAAVIAAGCLNAALKIGDHIGSANLARAKIIATGLGTVIGAIAVIVYNLLSKIGYSWFARMTIEFHYGQTFSTRSSRTDQGFLAGQDAVTSPGGGSVSFPAAWPRRLGTRFQAISWHGHSRRMRAELETLTPGS
jgi:hypothetical protein